MRNERERKMRKKKREEDEIREGKMKKERGR